VVPNVLHSIPFTVGEHDFDGFYLGADEGLELWTAFLPVGYGVPAMDKYESWGDQLRLFLTKAAAFHENPGQYARNLYHLGNDLNMVGQLEAIWDLIGPESIDYYAVNTLGAGQCDGNSACYRRAPMEDYESLTDFLDYARQLEWMGEGWQDPAVFLEHMNTGDHFPRRVVWWNVHSSPGHSLISAAQARNDIDWGRGGAVALMNGCLVGSYVRPGETLPPHAFAVPHPFDNVMASLLYGQSAFIAAVGSVPPRGSSAYYGLLLDRIYTDGYLGQADRERSDYSDMMHPGRMDLRGHWDILIGDPFVDAYQCPDGPQSCSSEPDTPEVRCPHGPGYYCGETVNLDPGTLYHCSGNLFAVQKVCPNGCQAMEGAHNDRCEPTDICPDGPGLYCGDTVGRDPNVLYGCNGGEFVVHELCGNGCRIAPPGQDDMCEPNGSCPQGNGWYCGSSVGRDPDTLYYCENGNLTVTQTCAAGCRIAPSGQADFCEPNGVCPNGNGWYCGETVGLDPSTVYHCRYGNYAVQQVCAHGCQVAPAGEADFCRPEDPNCPAGTGFYCGGAVGRDPDILYFCENGLYSEYEYCGSGCRIAETGEADFCEQNGTCPNGNGWYCGGSVGMDVNTLFYCYYGNLRMERYCLDGCYAAPPGEADDCL
jgi:hypothetical protein